MNHRGQPMSINIYQPYIHDAQLSKIAKNCIPYKVNNIDKESREYELFNGIAKMEFGTNNDPSHFFGLISLKFEIKSPIDIKIFRHSIKSAQNNFYDAYVINPMLANEALFWNGWEQASAAGHKGIEEIYQYICKMIPTAAQIRNQNIFALNNYFVGNRKFWTEYFAFMNPILIEFEAESKLNSNIGQIFDGPAGYYRDNNITMRPFVIERLATEFYYHAMLRGLKIKFFKPTQDHYVLKFGKTYGSEIFKLSSIKLEGSLNNDRILLEKWKHARTAILNDHGKTLLQLDDPDQIDF